MIISFATLVLRAAMSAALATAAVSAHALVTYTYTGPDLNSFGSSDPTHPVNTHGLIASFVFSDFLGANLGSTDNFELVAPLSWSINGGGYGLTSNDANANLNPDGVAVFTDASGALQGWDYQASVFNGFNTVGQFFRSYFYPTGQHSTFGATERLDSVYYFNQPTGFSRGENTSLGSGSWSVTSAAVPEPGSAALLLAGGAALGWLVRRRARA